MPVKLKKVLNTLTKEVIESIPHYFQDVVFENHTLYHRSPFDIKQYNHSHAVAIRKERKTHDNSVLGLWASTYPHMCRSFGSFNYQLNKISGLICKGLDLKIFYYLTADLNVNDQLRLREKMLESCDVIYLIDATKKINEVIILSTDKISITKVSNDIPDKEYALGLC